MTQPMEFGSKAGVCILAKSKGRSIGEEENLCSGKAQSGILISTCLDLTPEESPTDLGVEKGKFGSRVLCEMDFEVREELVPREIQGLSGATDGS